MPERRAAAMSRLALIGLVVAAAGPGFAGDSGLALPLILSSVVLVARAVLQRATHAGIWGGRVCAGISTCALPATTNALPATTSALPATTNALINRAERSLQRAFGPVDQAAGTATHPARGP